MEKSSDKNSNNIECKTFNENVNLFDHDQFNAEIIPFKGFNHFNDLSR